MPEERQYTHVELTYFTKPRLFGLIPSKRRSLTAVVDGWGVPTRRTKHLECPTPITEIEAFRLLGVITNNERDGSSA